MLGGGGGRASTICDDLLYLAEPGWSPPPPSQSGAGVVPDDSPFAASYVPPSRPPPQMLCLSRRLLAALRKRTCNPEMGVGLLAAVAEPASARLRVAGPVRAGASGIMAAVVAADLVFCNGTSGGARRVVINEVLVACKVCRRRLDDRTIYLYMDKGFCNPECRYKYFIEELYDYEQRQKLAAEARASKTAGRHGKADLHVEAPDRSSRRRIFFAPDEEMTTPGHSTETDATPFSSCICSRIQTK
ncbi:unnamed protein product [Urochloa decumbens]|uniref:FLZ-type domain-containing protein n=1 Tax=Urochloa decumbens TaxID=240449 RepID=A0ABC9ERG0_9POAL